MESPPPVSPNQEPVLYHVGMHADDADADDDDADDDVDVKRCE